MAELGSVASALERRGYLTVLIANALYGVVGVIHFFQHLNHKEADLAHFAAAGYQRGGVCWRDNRDDGVDLQTKNGWGIHWPRMSE